MREIFDADDPLVVNGTYDVFGYKPGERARIAKAHTRQLTEAQTMAKKKAAKVTKPTKVTTPKRRPRQVPLSGMEDVRIRSLDECAASISEIREAMNDLRQQEADYLKRALTLMRKHERETWRSSGVELVRVPGEERLRVRTSKEKATAEVEDEERVEVIDDVRGDDEPADVVSTEGADAEPF